MMTTIIADLRAPAHPAGPQGNGLARLNRVSERQSGFHERVALK